MSTMTARLPFLPEHPRHPLRMTVRPRLLTERPRREPAVSTDTLSEVLRAVRLTGAVFFSVDAASPWVAEAPAGHVIGERIMPGIDHVIEYHLVTSGTCFGGLVGEPAVELHAGDIIAFPQGDAHVMSSAPGMRGQPNVDVFTRPIGGTLPVYLQQGQGPAQAHLICGFLGCDARPFNPLLAALPRLLHVRPNGGDDGLLGQFVRFALAESSARSSGSECVLARLSELMFVEVVRRYVSSLPDDQTGWLAGLRDVVVGRALMHLHDRPAHTWTLEELARESGTSRSVLADRFAFFVGVPPMQYLGQWRMQLAAALLAGSGSIAEVATEVGYSSEAAFSRAFKKIVGVAPARWRQGERRSAA
jgi:AraC-like DNA-binding protein